jgi:hypothetical protein
MNTTAYDTFLEQKDAYLAGNMGKVREMSIYAKSLLNLPNQEDWEKAKSMLDEMKFPADNDLGWREVFQKERHSAKKEMKHNLKTYKKWTNILNFELEAKYNYCEECSTMRNAVLTLFNSQDSETYQKWFVFEGKEVGKKSINEVARSIFSVLAIVVAI